jgi:hypothetical protein
MSWKSELERPPPRIVRLFGRFSSFGWLMGRPSPPWLGPWGFGVESFANGQSGSCGIGWPAWRTNLAAGARPAFPPDLAFYLVKLACELPDKADRSLSLWTCGELARTVQDEGIVDSISVQSVQRILLCHRLKPWRVHHWLSSDVPRDEAFRRQVLKIRELYTRSLAPDERVLSLDEKTSIQPRPRTNETLPPQPGGVPARVEHEYVRMGALNLMAAFDTRTGEVFAICRKRKRQAEFIELLEEVDERTPNRIRVIHLVCDNVSMHRGRLTQAWLKAHPRFRMHFTPVHCSWMNQVEQWFSILQRKRLVAPNFADLEELESRLMAFIDEWNATAHPFRWTKRSFDKILAKVDQAIELKAA